MAVVPASQSCREAILARKLSPLPAEVQEALRLDDSRRTARQRELATLYADRTRVEDGEIQTCLNRTEAERLDTIERRLVSMFANFRAKPFACGVADIGDHSPRTLLPARGAEIGQPVIAGFPAIFGGGDIQDRVGPRHGTGPIPLKPTTERRRALADWIAGSDNPLTARVMVNRIWQYHFGRGLVATASDFGARGRAPSHPELLDWLAAEFVEHGWSVKHIHRLILHSAAYRQATNPSPEASAKDPENIYLSHFSRRRLSSEEMRDAMLVAAGAINLKMGGPPAVPPLAPEAVDLGRESEATKKLYGIGEPLTDDFGRKCLLARRLVERGVRFIQLYSGTHLGGDDWDRAHTDLIGGHTKMAAKTDRPVAALLTDLKARGLLDSTLVIWGSEFGRTPLAEGRNGRDHHPYAFSMWMAGAGIQGGRVLGSSDGFGLRPVQDPVDAHDVNATVQRLLGLDHTQLTYFYQGRDQRLTDVHGQGEFTSFLLRHS